MALQLNSSLILAALLAGNVAAQQATPHATTVQTVQEADARLAQVRTDRATVEQAFTEQEALCYQKFFVNNCLDKAKEERRQRLAALRSIEIDANYFKRKQAVDERDRELEERARKDGDDTRGSTAPARPKTMPADKPRPQPLKQTPAQRQAEHDARVQEREAQEAAGAGERARKVEQYQQKQAESRERQEAIARKKAEREARQARRAAEAAAKAAADADKARQQTK